ncbi:hypothetical protein M2282_000006 [Variovorax boronicumulans]|nr:hypothetical protein [Variovorax boronicumulans]
MHLNPKELRGSRMHVDATAVHGRFDHRQIKQLALQGAAALTLLGIGWAQAACSLSSERMHADREEKLVAARKAYTDGLLYLAFDRYQVQANDGHVESEVFVAWMLSQGVGCEKDEPGCCLLRASSSAWAPAGLLLLRPLVDESWRAYEGLSLLRDGCRQAASALDVSGRLFIGSWQRHFTGSSTVLQSPERGCDAWSCLRAARTGSSRSARQTRHCLAAYRARGDSCRGLLGLHGLHGQ